MKKLFYFDTSIWLDFFEDRNEPNMQKGEWIHKLMKDIIINNCKILYSDNNLIELYALGYSRYEINDLLKPIKQVLIFVGTNEKQIGKAKDLSMKRSIPKRDALHAVIARDNNAVLITFDKHFQNLLDIVKPMKPQDITLL